MFHTLAICIKSVASQNIKCQENGQKLDERHFSQLHFITDYNFNIISLAHILYRKQKSLNKRNLKGHYFDDFMQLMILNIILLVQSL